MEINYEKGFNVTLSNDSRDNSFVDLRTGNIYTGITKPCTNGKYPRKRAKQHLFMRIGKKDKRYLPVIARTGKCSKDMIIHATLYPIISGVFLWEY